MGSALDTAGVDVNELLRAQRELEQELHRSQARLRDAQRIAQIGSWELDLVTNEAVWSEETYRIVELDPAQRTGLFEAFVARVHPEDRPREIANFERAVAEQRTLDATARLVMPDGRIKHVRQRAQFMDVESEPSGRARRMLGTIEDVTSDVHAEREHLSAERHVRRARDLLRAVIDSSPDWIFAKDREHRFLLVNKSFAEAQGLAPDDMLGRPDTDFWSHALCEGDPSKLSRSFHADDREAFDGNLIRNPNAVGTLAHGGLRTLDIFKSPLRDEHGTIYGVLAYARDVTEQRRTHEAMRQLNAELEQRVSERTASLEAINRELETFTYSVSHDLKAPLRAIEGYSQLLLLDHASRLNDGGQKHLAAIQAAAIRMGRLIDGLLAYSLVQSRSQHVTEVDLPGLVQRVCQEFEAQARECGARFELDLRCERLHADDEGLALTLRNLVDNALKFRSDGRAPIIQIGARMTTHACTISVRDNGVGFEMKYHERIFCIFQRLHRAEEYSGTGVGLAIVRKAMERMGGRIWAESHLGEGATFFVEIPA
jgi:PAS domain S-box-containing protein